MRLLSQTENGRSNFFICLVDKLPKQKKSKKNSGTWIFGPGRKNGRNHGSARLGLKMAEIQKSFFLLSFATLWPNNV